MVATNVFLLEKFPTFELCMRAQVYLWRRKWYKTYGNNAAFELSRDPRRRCRLVFTRTTKKQTNNNYSSIVPLLFHVSILNSSLIIIRYHGLGRNTSFRTRKSDRDVDWYGSSRVLLSGSSDLGTFQKNWCRQYVLHLLGLFPSHKQPTFFLISNHRRNRYLKHYCIGQIW